MIVFYRAGNGLAPPPVPLLNCRTCKAEMKEKDDELLDLDQALKDRNWELKQRAAQVSI